jgi:hypothetical protein
VKEGSVTKTFLRGAITLLICLGLPAGYAFAENHDRGKEQHERVERERAHQRAEVRHEQRREWRDHERQREIAREHERERWQREHAANRQPSGWNHGKKEGWKKCDVPPGKAKTNGCDMKAYYARHPEWRPR